MQDYEQLARELEKKAADLREEGRAAQNSTRSGSICCGTCQFISPCNPDATPAKCEGGCTITSFI